MFQSQFFEWRGRFRVIAVDFFHHPVVVHLQIRIAIFFILFHWLFIYVRNEAHRVRMVLFALSSLFYLVREGVFLCRLDLFK